MANLTFILLFILGKDIDIHRSKGICSDSIEHQAKTTKLENKGLDALLSLAVSFEFKNIHKMGVLIECR